MDLGWKRVFLLVGRIAGRSGESHQSGEWRCRLEPQGEAGRSGGSSGPACPGQI